MRERSPWIDRRWPLVGWHWSCATNGSRRDRLAPMESAALHDGTYTVLGVERKSTGGRAMGEWHELVGLHGGVELGEATSGLVAAFRSATAAVRCAVALQEAQEAPSQLAVGVQTGEL